MNKNFAFFFDFSNFCLSNCKYEQGFAALALHHAVQDSASAIPNLPRSPFLCSLYEKIRTSFRNL
jgi:hypothetical protein